jgi:hypothetical protein
LAHKPKTDEKSLRVREIEAKARVRARIIDTAGAFANKLLKYGCIAFCVWTAGDAVKSLSGRTTLADMRFNFLGSVAVERTLCIGAAAGGIGYGYRTEEAPSKKRPNTCRDAYTNWNRLSIRAEQAAI